MSDRYVVLTHGLNHDVVDLGPCAHRQPARLLATATCLENADLVAQALNEAHRAQWDSLERDQAEATIMELDDTLLTMSDGGTIEESVLDSILADARARQEARA